MKIVHAIVFLVGWFLIFFIAPLVGICAVLKWLFPVWWIVADQTVVGAVCFLIYIPFMMAGLFVIKRAR